MSRRTVWTVTGHRTVGKFDIEMYQSLFVRAAARSNRLWDVTNDPVSAARCLPRRLEDFRPSLTSGHSQCLSVNFLLLLSVMILNVLPFILKVLGFDSQLLLLCRILLLYPLICSCYFHILTALKSTFNHLKLEIY